MRNYFALGKIIALSLVAAVHFAGSALAGPVAVDYASLDTSSLVSMMSGIASSSSLGTKNTNPYFVTYLGSYTKGVTSYDGSIKGGTLTYLTQGSALGDTVAVKNLNKTYFIDPSSSWKLNDKDSQVQVYALDSALLVNGVTLSAGSIIVGLDSMDQFKTKKNGTVVNFGDGDYNDFVVALSKSDPTSKTPVPAAFWLLSSGVVGLVGMKRRFM